ncbi:hypothetical protein [uncultured Clostridium sp.]|uniref:hypothetical protein n=1 Tax=uncultured Clostridium sp. TaxID=59620 RepID=UPI0025E61F2B|nr:hypothetical protein [uncultured Clostridium sp.]
MMNHIINKGKEEQVIETAKVAIKEGMSDELITKLTGLTESQISIILKRRTPLR